MRHEINKVMTEEIADKIVEKLLREGLLDEPNSMKANISYALPQNQWEVELALNSLGMATLLNLLLMKYSDHKYEEDEKEQEFWNRFSDEIKFHLEDAGLFDLIAVRME